MQLTALPRYQPERRISQREWLILAASVLVHLVFLRSVTAPQPKSPEELLRVRFAPPEAKQEPIKKSTLPSQIVSPSDATPLPPVEPTNQKSEHDSRAEVEQIKRGEEHATLRPPSPESKAQKPAPASRRSVSPDISKPQKSAKHQAETPPRKNITRANSENLRMPVGPGALTLNQGDLNRTLAAADQREVEKQSSREPKSEAERTSSLARYQPFSHNTIFQNPGINDYLPNLREGDITLLNAKADHYAVFVRRVAMQVFGILRRSHWQELSAQELLQIGKLSTIRATLSPKGKLLQVEILESSGSSRFDNVVKHAAELGGSDQNPPAGAAAEDGNIHFIFKSRTWVRPGPQGLREQRWLLLATGLL